MLPKRFTLFIFLIIILDLSGFAQLGFQTVPIRIRGGEVTAYKQSFALVIGVTNYQNGLPPLPGVSLDMSDVKQALEEQGFKVTLILDPDLTELDRAFSGFITTYGLFPDARLLFYFAGHGYTIKTKLGEELGYIVPANAPNPTRDQVGFQNNAMEMSQIEVYTKRIKSKHALFLFDACFSGSLFATSMTLPQPLSQKTLQPVREFITSGTADEQVPDKSIFCSQFLLALKGEADMDHDGYVTGTELGAFIQQSVINYSYETQHPQFGKIRNPNLDKGDFVFVIPTPGPAAMPPSASPGISLVTAPTTPPTVRQDETKNESPAKGTGELKVYSEVTGDLFIDDIFYQTIVEKSTVLFFNVSAGKHILHFSGSKNIQKEIIIIKDQTNAIDFGKD
ncbi:MAG: caspase family protein [Bacteroidales bacterium]|nr:caspase family protein [Bacteroidales bacterium]